MIQSLYEYLDEIGELKPTTCDWCNAKYQDLYAYNDENVCRECLSKTSMSIFE